jgi:transcription elongation factor Elf1
LFLFFILPNIITKTFINLSILAVIYDIRNVTFSTDHLNTDKIRTLLQISVSEEILLLPGYTIHWFWNDNFLNTVTTVHGEELTLRELITDNKLFFTHLRTIIDLFVANLPNLLKIKMGLMKRDITREEWNGFITPENTRIRQSAEGKAWTYDVLAKATFTCDKCGQKGGNLCAHHLNGFNKFPEQRFDPENGVCLCSACHDAFHDTYGRGDNTVDQYKEFKDN